MEEASRGLIELQLSVQLCASSFSVSLSRSFSLLSEDLFEMRGEMLQGWACYIERERRHGRDQIMVTTGLTKAQLLEHVQGARPDGHTNQKAASSNLQEAEPHTLRCGCHGKQDPLPAGRHAGRRLGLVSAGMGSRLVLARFPDFVGARCVIATSVRLAGQCGC